MANQRINRTPPNRAANLYPCACSDMNGNVTWHGYTQTKAECTNKCKKAGTTASGGDANMRRATGTSFQRPRKGGTGEHVAWRNQSGTILGYTTQQVLIAVGVGVAAYFLYKKLK